MNGPILLTAIWLVPLLTLLATLPVDRRNHGLVKRMALAGNSLNLGLIIWLAVKFSASAAALGTGAGTDSTVLHFALSLPWFELLNIEYNIGVDGISVLMILLTGIVILTGILASWQITDQAKEFFALLNILVTGVYGVFISFDLFTFFLFYEIAVLPMYLLIGIWGSGRKECAAMKLTLMLVAGSAFILAAIMALYFESGIASFNLLKLARVEFAPAFQLWAFPLIFAGFGVLGALFPFHTWSPDGHAAAPTAVSMLHAGS